MLNALSASGSNPPVISSRDFAVRSAERVDEVAPVADRSSVSREFMASALGVGVSSDQSAGYAGLSDSDLKQVYDVIAALVQLRDAEQELNRVSAERMGLNETDMRALHFLSLCANTGHLVTASELATYLDISSASTTKLLDRLEHSGHLLRQEHPKDRRALAISITESTHVAMAEIVGNEHHKRLCAIARLSSRQRQTVIDFLTELAGEIGVVP